MLLENSLRSILRRTCNGILKGKSVPLKEEYQSLSGSAKRGRKLVLIVIWLYVALENESIEEYELPTANEITEFELDRESETEEDEDNFEVTDSSSFSKNESCD